MQRVFTVWATAIASIVLALTACGGPGATGTTSTAFPTSVQVVTVPANMKMKSGIHLYGSGPNTNGWAYDQMRQFIDIGQVASTGIDWYLARISEASNFFKRVIGKYTNYSAGNWVYYNTNAESSFIYFGTNTSLTNLYLEWAFSADKKLKGRAEVYLQGANNDFSKGFVSFDATVTVPVMEIYLAMNASKTIFSKFHIKLEKNADGYVIVTAKGILTNALTNSGTALGNKSAEPKVWDLVGVGKDSANGGVYAWAQGVATDINNDPRWDSSYDYKYNEFFSANSLVLWKLGVFVVNTIPDTNIYVTNKDGRFYYTNTSADLYTNNTKPADANTALIANTNKRLTSADYPSLTLYK